MKPTALNFDRIANEVLAFAIFSMIKTVMKLVLYFYQATETVILNNKFLKGFLY